MPGYRLFFSDKDAHILGPAIEVELADDPTAIAKAVEIGLDPVFGATHVEVWEHARLVERVPVNIPIPLPRRPQ